MGHSDQAARASADGLAPGSTAGLARSSTGAALRATDRIVLRGIEGFGRHGVFPSERERGQRFVVDVVCALDLAPAAANDDLEQTVDYGALAAAVRSEIEGPPVQLIETLAGRIADLCLSDVRVVDVEVTVHKPEAPLPVPVTDVAVTVTRSRLA